MSSRLLLCAALLWLAVSAEAVGSSPVYTAAEVASYAPGSGVFAGLTAPVAALGLPSAVTGTNSWDGNLSPFNSHYRDGEIVQVGQGGHITLRLERFVHPSPGVASIGVWENVFLVTGADGRVGTPPGLFGADSALTEASADGTNFVSAGLIEFGWFGNYWADSLGPFAQISGSIRADFGRPHGRSPADFSGADYASVLSLLGGTAGGTWIDLSVTGLERVGWIRFSGVQSGATLEIDAVSINRALAGAPTLIPVLRLEAAAEANRITFPGSLSHAVYQLQFSDDLAQNWQNLGEPIQGTGNDLLFTDSSSPRPAKRFYRVLLP
ncbi:MAG: hypothetical protein ACKOB0_01415 [Chthoniobacterales bacterium]